MVIETLERDAGGISKLVDGTATGWRPSHLTMAKFLLWCILLVLCWPLALLALILYPVVWLLLLPFRLLGIAVGGVFALLAAIIMFPARVLSGPRAV